VKIVAGLGNPGPRYARTRHNAGWMALERLAELCDAVPQPRGGGGALARSGRLWLLKPPGYMNRCGPPVARLLEALGAGRGDLLVLVDDVNLRLGSIRLRRGGSSGGHNGLQSLIEALGTEAFPRLRMGIGPCPPGEDMRRFVLGPFEPDQREAAEQMADRAARAALCWGRDGIEVAMDRFNRKVENQGES